MMRRGASCGWEATLPPLRGLDKFMLIDIDFSAERENAGHAAAPQHKWPKLTARLCGSFGHLPVSVCVCRAACSHRYTNRQMMVPMPSVVRLSGTEKRHL